MPNWRTIEETDLAANVSQSEIDAYRADGALDGSDPVRQLLVSTVDAVRGYISCNGSVRMGPSGTIPRGLVIPAMDYAMGKVLNRIGVPLSEDRREALRKAQELFEKIAKGEITPESYSEDGEIDESTRPATSPIADDGPRRTLGGGLWSIAAALLAVLSASAKTFDVDISTGRPAASNEAFYHGETIEFRAVRGRSVVTNIEYSCIWYTTNNSSSVASGEGGWWKTDGLVFHPTNDCGAAAYRFFLEGRDDLGRDWHANGLLRFLPSPGFTPNTLPLPVATLDFAQITVLNPPWSDVSADLTPATNYTDSATNAAQTAAITAANAYTDEATNYVWQSLDMAWFELSDNYRWRLSVEDALPGISNRIDEVEDYFTSALADATNNIATDLIMMQSEVDMLFTVTSGHDEKITALIAATNDLWAAIESIEPSPGPSAPCPVASRSWNRPGEWTIDYAPIMAPQSSEFIDLFTDAGGIVFSNVTRTASRGLTAQIYSESLDLLGEDAPPALASIIVSDGGSAAGDIGTVPTSGLYRVRGIAVTGAGGDDWTWTGDLGTFALPSAFQIAREAAEEALI